MRLLITGGAGYIGGFVTRELVRRGHEVVVVDDLSGGHREAAGDARVIVGDFGDREMVRELLATQEIHAVLHFAGLKSVAESWEQPLRYLDVNVGKTIALLGAMDDANVELLVYSSSCAIYGAATQLPVDETQPPAPMNPYAQTKWLAEQALQLAAASSSLRYTALRYFNAAGADPEGTAGEDLERSVNLIPMVMKTALGLDQVVVIHGTDYPTADGSAVRDYVHVIDLAEAHARALDYLSTGGQSIALNIGTGRGTSVKEVVAEARRASGRPIPAVGRQRRPGDPPAMWADVDLARRTLGWESRHGIEEIVSSAWSWHAHNVLPPR